MSFFATDSVTHEGKTNTWLTPPWIVQALGEFDLDPCAHPANPTARNRVVLPEDGLSAEWSGRVWLNPPYGKEIVRWLDKLHAHGNGIALVFNRADTAWFQKHLNLAHGAFFMSGRVRFLNEEMREVTNAGTGSVLLAYGRKNADALRESPLKGIFL